MADLDLVTGPDVEPAEEPYRFPRRRLLRWLAILTLGIVVVLAVWQDPLYAGL